MSKVIGPPAWTAGKIIPKRLRYSGTLFMRLTTSLRKSKLSPGKSKPAASTRSVGGIKAWATRRWGKYDRLITSGAGNSNPALLTKGLSDKPENREFHISWG